ncbi:response regulator [Pseudohoeflea coraliihabitans]|uniref:Response regulator n=1 Tax=Pseudohoeflea coraliihabitans TaxID=2860393 RepID=A0ABS6WMS4_9HYPH|nr:response regulator [Pseudohoeflea sp. DP4N28-3]MBW3097085.1 response regulator [Pseudohoeflea sp. DP4N28-3]
MNTHDIFSETDHVSLLQALGCAVGAALCVFDRNDVLLYASADMQCFYPIPDAALVPGIRLRDFLGAVYDSGVRPGMQNCSDSEISRHDWIAERTALHWRERHEQVEQLVDGRWVKLGKRRLPSGVALSYVVDITEQMQRERHLSHMSARSELAQHILDKLPNPILVKDSRLRYILVNEAFCRLLGLDSHAIIGRTASDLVGPEAAARFEANERELLVTGTPVEYREDIQQADGSVLQSMTRKQRTGSAFSYFITVSINPIASQPVAAAAPEQPQPADCASGAMTGPDGGQSASASAIDGRRVLVVDVNAARAAARVDDLRRKGNDALPLPDLARLPSFLAMANRMAITIDRLELSPDIQAQLDAGMEAPVNDALTALRAAGTLIEEMPIVGVGRIHPDRPALAQSQPSGSSHGATAAPATRAASAGVLRGRRTDAADQRPRVLVAEDNEINQVVFQQILDDIGVDYRLVGNGRDAVVAWRDHKPDLILMDVSMPIMSGHDATRTIRAAENAEGKADFHVPILAITAHALAGDCAECFAAGMDDYLTKPISPEKLQLAIDTWAGRRIHRDSPA